MKLLLAILTVVAMSHNTIAQDRIAVFKVERPLHATNYLDEVSSHIISLYANDDRFIVIDKANSQLIENEQDRQKNEAFIDGYIVEQGVQEGFDYCYYSKYLPIEKKLSIKLYDVARGTVIAGKNITIKTSIIGLPKNLFVEVDEAIAEINESVFEIKTEVVRIISEKNNKARVLLVAVGRNQNAQIDQPFDIYYIVEERLGDKKLLRNQVLGEGSIKEIEDGNFSQLKVTSGNADIYKFMISNKPLYLKRKID